VTHRVIVTASSYYLPETILNTFCTLAHLML
jgi:hypothetical protein